MPARSSREERTYRRGLVMGLTMAEIMVLIIFALLLILAKIVTVAEPPEMPKPFTALVEKWRKASPGENNFDDKAQELIAAAEFGSAAGEALLVPSMRPKSQATGRGSAVDARHVKAEIERLKQVLETGRMAEATAGKNNMGMTPQDAAREFLSSAGAAYEKGARSHFYGSSNIWIADVVKKADLAKGPGGDGTEHPPCSATDGKPDFIFDVHLKSTFITVHDNQLPQISNKRAEWPTERIRFDVGVSRAGFTAMTDELFQWSKARQCRFFVRILDETAAHEKAIYKIQLRTVGYHFYYFEPLD
jgi:hypothetical protein